MMSLLTLRMAPRETQAAKERGEAYLVDKLGQARTHPEPQSAQYDQKQALTIPTIEEAAQMQDVACISML